MPEALRKKKRMTSFQGVILGFAAIILLGACLLMLPLSSRMGTPASFSDALFTSTSAVCVTGLVVRDTASYWSAFGQAVILILIQIGGLGVVTVAASLALLSGRKISLLQRSAMQEAVAAPKVGGIVRLTGFILRATFAMELLGALAMLPVFWSEFGPGGIWRAVFHSVSAFCNAGFDLMGSAGREFVSLTGRAGDPLVNVVVMLLIIVGGIGFLTWDDVRSNGLRLKRYRMQSKVILAMTGILIAVPALYFYFFEFAELPRGERMLSALFQAVTPRTAGFNTQDLTAVSSRGQGVLIALMLIGGSPGSTAGGMKTTTVAVLVANVLAVFQRREDARLFDRRIEDRAVRTAATVLVMYLALFYFGALAISAVENLPMGACLFETASAVGTVGLTLGITPGLGLSSRCVLIALMFLGRAGGLTLIYAALSEGNRSASRYPQERITIG